MITLQDGTASLDLALSVAEYFRLSRQQAEKIISEVQLGVSEWRSVAQHFHLKKSEIERMASAFFKE